MCVGVGVGALLFHYCCHNGKQAEGSFKRAEMHATYFCVFN